MRRDGTDLDLGTRGLFASVVSAAVRKQLRPALSVQRSHATTFVRSAKPDSQSEDSGKTVGRNQINAFLRLAGRNHSSKSPPRTQLLPVPSKRQCSSRRTNHSYSDDRSSTVSVVSDPGTDEPAKQFSAGAMCVQRFNDRFVLRFTFLLAVRFGLPRPASLVIHRSELFTRSVDSGDRCRVFFWCMV